jgi:hypothetical protein
LPELFSDTRIPHDGRSARCRVTKASHVAQLNEVLASGSPEIEVTGRIRGIASLSLPPRISLRDGESVVSAKGVKLTCKNPCRAWPCGAPPHERAIYNDPTVADLGTLPLRNVTTHGQIYLSI